MARQRMVTRTITSTVYEVMTVNTGSNTVENIKVTLPSTDALTDKVISELIRKGLPETNLFVQVVKSEKIEKLFGMTETDFMKYAKELPPRTATE